VAISPGACASQEHTEHNCKSRRTGQRSSQQDANSLCRSYRAVVLTTQSHGLAVKAPVGGPAVNADSRALFLGTFWALPIFSVPADARGSVWAEACSRVNERSKNTLSRCLNFARQAGLGRASSGRRFIRDPPGFSVGLIPCFTKARVSVRATLDAAGRSPCVTRSRSAIQSNRNLRALSSFNCWKGQMRHSARSIFCSSACLYCVLDGDGC
jgi:hypothetical protein